jgi:glutathione peroxidase
MRNPFIAALVVGIAVVLPAVAADKEDRQVPPVLNFKMTTLDGKPVELSKFQGKVVLLVNVASECGYTPQYKGLQWLHEKYGKDGLVVLGVPSNDYGGQEPGTNADIAAFCQKNYDVKFDMLAKVGVAAGKDQCPLYRFLTSKETNPKFGGAVKWNFEKFLIGRNGEVVGRYEADVEPDAKDMVEKIEAELGKK